MILRGCEFKSYFFHVCYNKNHTFIKLQHILFFENKLKLCNQAYIKRDIKTPIIDYIITYVWVCDFF